MTDMGDPRGAINAFVDGMISETLSDLEAWLFRVDVLALAFGDEGAAWILGIPEAEVRLSRADYARLSAQEAGHA